MLPDWYGSGGYLALDDHGPRLVSAGERVVTSQTRQAMEEILARIRDGAFAHEWLREQTTGGKRLAAFRAEEAALPLEAAGAFVRDRVLSSRQPSRT